MEQLALAMVLKKIDELPSLPVVTSEVINLIENPEISAQQVSESISKDQVLTGKILKMVNSAYYGLPRKVATLTEAVTILGMDTLRTLTIGFSAYRTFSYGPGVKGLTTNQVLQHSLACAGAAKAISQRIGYQMAEQAFLAGLLHDIGKMVLVNFLKEEYTQVIEKTNAEEKNLVMAEVEVLGLDHAQLGKMLAEKWNLPDILIAPIANHHKPDRNSEHLLITQIVHLANALAVTAGYGMGNDRDYFLDMRTLDDVKLSFEDIMGMVPEVRGYVSTDLLI